MSRPNKWWWADDKQIMSNVNEYRWGAEMMSRDWDNEQRLWWADDQQYWLAAEQIEETDDVDVT